MAKRHDYKEMNKFYAAHVHGNGYSFYETNEHIRRITNEYVLDHLEKLEYHYTITVGLYATDRPEKVIDTENVLFQIPE